MGSAIAIIVGQLLGAGELDEARDTDTKLIAFSVMSCFVTGGILFLLSPFFPELYNAEDNVKALATGFIRVSAVCMPIYAFMHASYFTLRSGGKTLITFLFDSCFVWVFSIPLAYVLAHYTALPILTIFICCQLIEIIKCIIGFVLVKKGVWIQTITV